MENTLDKHFVCFGLNPFVVLVYLATIKSFKREKTNITEDKHIFKNAEKRNKGKDHQKPSISEWLLKPEEGKRQINFETNILWDHYKLLR